MVVTSSFSDSIVFAVHTRKTAFSNSTVFKSFHCGERFRNDPFSDRCSVDGSRIRNKTVSFSFENDNRPLFQMASIVYQRENCLGERA